MTGAGPAGHILVMDAIAVIEAEGPIMTGKDQGSNPFTGGKTIYSDDLADAEMRGQSHITHQRPQVGAGVHPFEGGAMHPVHGVVQSSE